MKLKALWLAVAMAGCAFAQDSSSPGTPQSSSQASAAGIQADRQQQTGVSDQKALDAGDVADLLAPGPLPKNPKLSLIGGTVVSLDRIRNRMLVRVFGGEKMRVDFDERSRIYRNGVETTSLGINQGDRVYLDTMLNGAQVFAKTIHVDPLPAQADAEGQLVSVNRSKNTFTVRDKLSDQPVTIALVAGSKILNQGAPGSSANLEPGALVKVHFMERDAARPEADTVYVLAAPGTAYTFYGEVSYIDKSQNLIAIHSTSGDRFYDIYVNDSSMPADLHIGATAKVTAQFDGTRYIARSISIEQPRQDRSSDDEPVTPESGGQTK